MYSGEPSWPFGDSEWRLIDASFETLASPSRCWRGPRQRRRSLNHAAECVVRSDAGAVPVINRAFVSAWRAKTGQRIVNMSHGGSGTQASEIFSLSRLVECALLSPLVK
jgi:hypothetical protein